MYPSIFYTLKRLKLRYLLKIANISAKKDISKIWNPEKSPYLCSWKTGTSPTPKKVL